MVSIEDIPIKPLSILVVCLVLDARIAGGLCLG
jgi:hypothetical protein